jgi:hypothetical protein
MAQLIKTEDFKVNLDDGIEVIIRGLKTAQKMAKQAKPDIKISYQESFNILTSAIDALSEAIKNSKAPVHD